MKNILKGFRIPLPKKPPKIIKHGKIYTRKIKHKGAKQWEI